MKLNVQSRLQHLTLLRKLMKVWKMIRKTCVAILKALIENDQSHIAKYIVSSGMNTRSPDRVLKKEEKEAIDENMFCFGEVVQSSCKRFPTYACWAEVHHSQPQRMDSQL